MMKSLNKEELVKLMDSLPDDSWLSGGWHDRIDWNSQKRKFYWQGWDDYNDTEGYDDWKIEPVVRITMKGNTIYLETEREVNMNDNLYPDMENKSYYLKFKVYLPARNLNLMLDKVVKS